MASQERTVGVEPWDTEWAAERAAEALRYLGKHYPVALRGGVLPHHTYPGRCEDLEAMRRFHAEHGIPPSGVSGGCGGR